MWTSMKLVAKTKLFKMLAGGSAVGIAATGAGLEVASSPQVPEAVTLGEDEVAGDDTLDLEGELVRVPIPFQPNDVLDDDLDSPDDSPAAQDDSPEDSPDDSPADSPDDSPAAQDDSPEDSPADSPDDCPEDSPDDSPADSPDDSPADSPDDTG